MEIKPYLRRPQFYETDGMSIIWHGNYVRWMEEARTDFIHESMCHKPTRPACLTSHPLNIDGPCQYC